MSKRLCRNFYEISTQPFCVGSIGPFYYMKDVQEIMAVVVFTNYYYTCCIISFSDICISCVFTRGSLRVIIYIGNNIGLFLIEYRKRGIDIPFVL